VNDLGNEAWLYMEQTGRRSNAGWVFRKATISFDENSPFLVRTATAGEDEEMPETKSLNSARCLR
jgi:hypothetical protein